GGAGGGRPGPGPRGAAAARGTSGPGPAPPAADAVSAFARLLRRDGVHVAGRPAAGRQPRHAVPVAAVRSPAVSEIVAWMLRESNNVIAENLARQGALHTGRPASSSGGGRGGGPPSRTTPGPPAPVTLVCSRCS